LREKIGGKTCINPEGNSFQLGKKGIKFRSGERKGPRINGRVRKRGLGSGINYAGTESMKREKRKIYRKNGSLERERTTLAPTAWRMQGESEEMGKKEECKRKKKGGSVIFSADSTHFTRKKRSKG